MSAWHREHPELIGTSADPWTMHDDYVKCLPHRSVIRPSEDLGFPDWYMENRRELDHEVEDEDADFIEWLEDHEWPPR